MVPTITHLSLHIHIETYNLHRDILHIHSHIHTMTHVHTHAHTHIHMNTYTRIHTFSQTHTHTFAYTPNNHTYTLILTHTHIAQLMITKYLIILCPLLSPLPSSYDHHFLEKFIIYNIRFQSFIKQLLLQLGLFPQSIRSCH